MPVQTGKTPGALRSNPYGKEIRMTDDEFEQVVRFIYEKTGIEFKSSKKYLLENRLSPRLVELGCTSYHDYLLLLKYDSNNEFQHFTSAITINETSFLRNMPQLRVFVDEVLPRVVKQAQDRAVRKVRLWSAGCSSGEEPYSLALLIAEKHPRLFNQKAVEIVATDIDEEILAKAREGVYSEFSLRNLSPIQKNNHFTREGRYFRITPKIKSIVRFTRLNLHDSARMRLMHDVDIIFFRNVMIYFGTEARKQILANMYDSLNPGGYLFLGHSESLHGLTKAFKLVNFGKIIVYQKQIRV